MVYSVVLLVVPMTIPYLWIWAPSKPNPDQIHVKINVVSRRVANSHSILIVKHKMTTGREMPHVTFAGKRAILSLIVVLSKLRWHATLKVEPMASLQERVVI